MSITLDVATLSFMSLFIFALMGGLLLMMWLGYRKENVLLYWIGSYALCSLGLVGLLLRGAIPDALSVVGANTLLIAGFVTAWWGNQHFFGRRPSYALGIGFTLAVAAAMLFFIERTETNFIYRVQIMSAGLTIASLLSATALFTRSPPSMWLPQGLAIFSHLSLAAFYALRLYTALHNDLPQGLMAPGQIGVLTYLLPTASCTLTAFAWTLLVHQRLRLRLVETHQFDMPTGALSRDMVSEIGAAEISRSRRHGNMLSVLMLDIDQIREVNQRHGQAAGNAWLRHLVMVARGVLRKEDQIGRLGGDDFCVILPQTDPHGAALLAERIRQSVEALPLTFGASLIPATVSIGVAALEPTDIAPDWERLTANADMALHDAKRMGRNRVALATAETALRLSGRS